MFEKLRVRSSKRQALKILASRDLSNRNTPLECLAFLVDEALMDNFEKFIEFGLELGLQPNNIKVFSFVDVKKKPPSMSLNQISKKDFGWRGEINNNHSATEFLEVPFDVLIGFYQGEHKFLDIMTARSKARFKIGYNQADLQLFDLLLSADLKNFEGFKHETTKYLKLLKKI